MYYVVLNVIIFLGFVVFLIGNFVVADITLTTSNRNVGWVAVGVISLASFLYTWWRHNKDQ
jgi:hypothetical protein